MYNIYVGSEVGLLKGIDTSKKTFENLNDVKELEQQIDPGILSMCWNDLNQSEILLGLKNKTVKIYDCEKNLFTFSKELDMGEGMLKNVARHNNLMMTAVDSGLVKIWDNNEEKAEINTGDQLSVMRHNISKPNIIATGGKQNEIRVWDINKPHVPIFKAKNVAANFLDIRMPIWVKELQFIPNSKQFVSGTAYNQVRLYDMSTSEKRPVIDMEFDKFPIVSIGLTPKPTQIVVANTHGRMALVDLRTKNIVHAFKKVAGSVRCIQVHPTLPIVVSSCIDRILRFHDLNNHTIKERMYLKSRLTTLLLCTKDPNKDKLFFDL